MRTKEEIQELYERELRPIINKGADTRRAWAKGNKFGTTFMMITLAATAIAYFVWDEEYYWLYLLVIGGFIAYSPYIYFSITGKVTDKDTSDLRTTYKTEIVPRIVTFLDPSFTYSKDAGITYQELQATQLFNDEYGSCPFYRSEDMVQGILEKVPFKFCEASTTDRIFHGLYLSAEFNKNINGRTFVLPEKFKRTTNLAKQEKQHVDSYGDLVRLENPEFEKIFSVYSDSQQEARYVITPAMMEAMVHVHEIVTQHLRKAKVFFSFVGNHVTCCMHNEESRNFNLFDPSNFDEDITISEIEFLVDLFSTIEIVIRELNLNTRIWTKE